MRTSPMAAALATTLAIFTQQGCGDDEEKTTASCTDDGSDEAVCLAASFVCGTAPDACGVLRACGDCQGATTCVDGACISDGTPPSGTLRIEDSCAPLSACGAAGRALVGRWYYKDACLEKAELLAPLYNICTITGTTPTIDSVSEATISGYLELSALGALGRTLSASAKITTTIPETCAGGRCGEIEQGLDAAFANTASCTGTSSCVCTFTASVNGADAGAYSVTGTDIVVNPGGHNSRTFAFCTGASDLVYTETTSPEHEPGIYTLAP